jgi:competence protein ComEA
VLVLLGGLAAMVAGIFVWWSRPIAEPIAAPAPITPAPVGMSPSPRPSVTVHVTGKVRRQGVLALVTGSRVVDAIEAAGGAREGAAIGGLNLARRLVDGEQIVVGAPAKAGGAPAADPVAGGLLGLNSATADQFEELPGVGEVLAQRIIEFRDAHGGFQSVDQLREVSGIGERKFAEIKDRVTP